ncbi:MAG: alpha-ketoglutaric semialdehyde dehydrogenase [Baekduia sp.]|jgi:aldehyde dehydrogenase (NAD+)|nr:alpha-ketoglutaric semialdehyde dehydrogenase [Baekduia sp.]
MTMQDQTIEAAGAPATPRRIGAHVGGWQAVDDAAARDVLNPADTRERVAVVTRSGPEVVDQALEVARDAAPSWGRTSALQRGAILARAAEIMASRAEEVAIAMTREMGKIIAESRVEAQRSAEFLRFFAQAPKLQAGATFPLGTPDEQAFTLRAPLGVVGLITPWNFPLSIPVWKTAAALAFGNAVVLKPAELSPWSAALMVECLLEAGLPPEVLSMLPGSGSEIGPALVDSPVTAGVSFTGSTPVGREIVRRGAHAGTRMQCEMGGRNAIVVMADADLDAAISAIVNAGFGTTGQRCTSSSRVIVERSIADEVTERLVQAASALSVGPGLDPANDIGPLASAKQLDDVLDALDRATSAGTEIVWGGSRLSEGRLAHGHFMEPTLTRDRVDNWFAGHEPFGPVISIFEADDFEDALAMNNSVEYGLASSIFTRDLAHAMRFVHESDTGMVHVNRPTVGAEPHIPFGGAKASSIGPPEMGGAHEFYTKSRSAHVRWA